MEGNPCPDGYTGGETSHRYLSFVVWKEFSVSVFAGPVGAVNMHYGDSLNDVSYNDILVSSCAEFGIAAFTGDGMDSNVMVAATEAIKRQGDWEFLQ